MKQAQIREVYQGQASPQSSCMGAWHPRKDDTHKSVRTWLNGQETNRIEGDGCEFLVV